MPELTPLDEYTPIVAAAERAGLRVYTRPVIEIDEDLLPKQYWKRSIDYSKIRRDIVRGDEIPGAKLTTQVQYFLSRRADGESE